MSFRGGRGGGRGGGRCVIMKHFVVYTSCAKWIGIKRKEKIIVMKMIPSMGISLKLITHVE